jgi:hypothetical protein
MITVDRYLSSKIIPMNVSGRSKEQIVKNAEATWLAPFVIDPLRTVCIEGCRCERCFQKACDALVAKSEAAVRGDLVVDEEIEFVG